MQLAELHVTCTNAKFAVKAVLSQMLDQREHHMLKKLLDAVAAVASRQGVRHTAV